MNKKAAVAGISGFAVALGVTELAHGLYGGVPSVLVSLAQVIAELTPGGIVTEGIELLGTADIPVLIGTVLVGALVVSVLLAILAVNRPLPALLGVAALGTIAVAASFAAEPFIDPAPAVLSTAGALLLGALTSELLLRSVNLRDGKGSAAGPAADPAGSRSPEPPIARWREAGPGEPLAVNRGAFVALAGGATVAGVAALGAGRLLAGGAREAAAPKRLDLPGSSEKRGGGAKLNGGKKASDHQTLPPPPEDASIEAPGMPKLITPASNFYVIDAALSSPRIDVSSWKLSVKGAVGNPFEITYKELLDMPTRESDVTLSCVSNPVGGGLVSNGRWTGVLLSDVLAEAGVRRGEIPRKGEQLVGRSVDGWTGGFRTDIALDGREALVAFGLNGSELPVRHGYPVRLVVPGLYGYVSATKWLEEIELTGWDFDAYWIQRTWSKEGPVKTQSRIDTVNDGQNLQAGKNPIGGVAWAPHRGIDKVEISTDNGETWNEARLAAQLDKDSWRQYLYEWDAEPGDHTLKVRATDGTGQTQTAKEAPPHPNGADGYHTINVSVD